MIREEIPAALAGERLDRIVALLTDASRSDAAALVASGGASLDGVVTTSGKLRVTLAQVVEIDPALLPQQQVPVADSTIDFQVAFVDDDVIVVDKPAGLVVHPGHGHPAGTLVNAVLARAIPTLPASAIRCDQASFTGSTLEPAASWWLPEANARISRWLPRLRHGLSLARTTRWYGVISNRRTDSSTHPSDAITATRCGWPL